MRRRALILASAASAAALLGGWQLGAAATSSLTADGAAGTGSLATAGNASGSSGSVGAAGGSGSAGSSSGSNAAGSAGGATASGSASASGAADGTYTGTSVSTRFGDVQVQVTVSGGEITEVRALQLTDHDGRSVAISNRAAPMLRTEVLQAQTASVSMISGATYTSVAYLQSLQSALDQAGF